MEYIIFDLEWNNAYNYKTQKGINEIIEIGAVKLNSSLETVDTFKQLIKPSLSKKLGSNFKRLTHITMEEIRQNGIPFDKAFSDFARWGGGGDSTVYLSWSNSDLYTLADNYKRFKNTCNIDFIKKYADAQSYCMQFISDHNGNQISLGNCAEKFEISVETENLHRALEDCYVTACCLKKVFDAKKFEPYIRNCDNAFFERLIFKPYYIDKQEYKDFRLRDVNLECPVCRGKVKPVTEYDYFNNTFKAAGKCGKCKKKFWIFVRAKQTYDKIVVSQRLIAVNKRRARHIG